MCKCIKRMVQRFRRLPTWMLFLHVTAKAVFAFGLGILLAGYLAGLGWWILLLGVVLAIPSAYKLLSGK